MNISLQFSSLPGGVESIEVAVLQLMLGGIFRDDIKTSLAHSDDHPDSEAGLGA